MLKILQYLPISKKQMTELVSNIKDEIAINSKIQEQEIWQLKKEQEKQYEQLLWILGNIKSQIAEMEVKKTLTDEKMLDDINQKEKVLTEISEICVKIKEETLDVKKQLMENNSLDIKRQIEKIKAINCEISEGISKNKLEQKEAYEKGYNGIHRISEQIESLISCNNQEINDLEEIMWGDIYNNSIEGSKWLSSNNFSPGRWAVGYSCLFLLYRVLDEMKPKKILEIGLGQSTKLINQYAKYYDISHTVVESNLEWVEFFTKSNEITKNTSIKILNCIFQDFKGFKVRRFDKFGDSFKKEKFDLIFIDAPLGSDMEKYSRIDVLDILEDCLEDSFAIIMHDTDRIMEQNTGYEIEKKLKEMKLDFRKGTYSGTKKTTIWVSMDNAFLCSM